MNKPAFRAVLFDLDGVIVDSMAYHFISWYEVLRPFGVRMTCFDIFMREGERWEKTARELLARAGIRPERKLLGRIFRRRKRLFRAYFKRMMFPGSLKLIERLKQEGFHLGLVTGTPLHDVRAILPAQTLSMFEAVVSGESTGKGKPHPDPYLKACRLLGVSAGECLVVENAPLGIESARRAGMRVVAISTSLPADFLKKADAVVGDISEAGRYIEQHAGLRGRKYGRDPRH